jgi:hypothetical protein
MELMQYMGTTMYMGLLSTRTILALVAQGPVSLETGHANERHILVS